MYYGFPKSVRLRKRHEFVVVQRAGLRFSRDGLIIMLRPNKLGAVRLGVTITRKSWPLATRRNRLRRVLREAFRLCRQNMPKGWDMVVVITRGAAGMTRGKAGELLLWATNKAQAA